MARRRHEEEHENHERWLVSYADFITLLFAFFVVMYAISSVNEGKYRVLSDSLVNAFRSNVNVQGATVVAPPQNNAALMPVVMSKSPPTDPKEEARKEQFRQRMRNVAEEIRRALAPLVRDGQVRVSEGVHGISVEINASVLFPPADVQLGPEAVRALRAVAGVVAGGDFPITVEGHTDNLPIRSGVFPSNWELSAVRASSVVRLFVEGGVDPRRLTAAGYGDQRPIADNTSVDGRARNRRVTILIESMLPEKVDASQEGEPRAGSENSSRSRVDGALGTPPNVRLVPADEGGAGSGSATEQP